MSQPSAPGGWLSPTRAWRLIECPTSVRPVAVGGVGGQVDEEINTGTLAHRVLERWIRTAGYRARDPKGALTEVADACVSELHGSPPSSWQMSRARLIARGISLVDMIGDRPPEHVLSEIKLQDEDLRLRGQLDLLLLGDEIVVVDLKTQTLLDEGLPEWVKFQLTVYAHLVQKTYGTLPTRAEVFSLNRGRREVKITEKSLGHAMDALAAARAADPADANPSPDTCRFCDRRLGCEPHWTATATWADADAVEGTVQRSEHAATGVVALLLETPQGVAWISGIPSDIVGEVGRARIRAIRLRSVRRDADDVTGWMWTPSSAVAVLQ